MVKKERRKRCRLKRKHLIVAFFITYSLFFLVDNGFLWYRDLSRYDANANPVCKWEPPKYNIPEDIDWHRTLVVGFPGAAKRLIFMQFEALTGWAAKDEWTFTYTGRTNHPFIKTNFPHHDGLWSWGDAVDQTVLVVRNMRDTMVEFHDIMWDLDYTRSFDPGFVKEEKLYSKTPSLEDFLWWRDFRLMREIHWYGWFIDYWMEGGLMRDLMSSRITIPEHWNKFRTPGDYTADELSYEENVPEATIVEPTYDPNCYSSNVSGGCKPVAVISGEKLLKGPTETHKLGRSLQNKHGISEYLIEEDAWDCIWKETIVKRKGDKTFLDRKGRNERNYNFSEEMLEEMIREYDRLIAKYSSFEWSLVSTARDLLQILLEHRGMIQHELMEVQSGERLLEESDFLGPKERTKRRMRKLRKNKNVDDVGELFGDHNEYFMKMERAIAERRRKRELERFLEQEKKDRKLTEGQISVSQS